MKDSTAVQDKITITMSKQKEIRDDKVAVILSCDGWWTEYHNYDLLFDPFLVEMIEQIDSLESIEDESEWSRETDKINDIIDQYLKQQYPHISFPPMAGFTLRVEWVALGEKFRIVEKTRYGEWDEKIELLTDTAWLDA